jgi:hypothetical protein
LLVKRAAVWEVWRRNEDRGGGEVPKDTKGALPSRRPAETATGLTGAVVAIIVATTGLSTELATALVVVVGAVPAIVTAVVSVTRSTAAGALLVGMTPGVAGLARATLRAASEDDVSLTDKTTTLKDVTESMESWSAVLSAEPGTSAAASGDEQPDA